MSHPLDGKYTTQGIVLDVTVAPCSWMYDNYGSQFSYVGDTCWGSVLAKNLPLESATKDDVQHLLDTRLTKEPCKTCRTEHLFNSEGNRKHDCEQCFIKKLNAKFEKEQAEEDAKEKQADAKMKAKGMTHKVIAWVHAGGDDYSIAIYTQGAPTATEVQKVLKRRRSKVLTDYIVSAL